VGAYVARQRLRKNDKFALVLQLEPLYQCNLACAGCGKIQHPDEILSRRLTVEQCVAAVEECGAPMVSIAGGEPLVHKQIADIVAALVERKRFVYLCTNAILMEKKLDLFTPSPYFSFSVHIDGLRERHDESVCREGVFDKAVAAIREAKRRGFRVTTNTTFFDLDDAGSIREVLDFLNDEVQVDTMQISPGYAYEKAPDQEHWLSVERTRRLFREAFADGRRRKWRLNHSPLFLDFLEGKAEFACTAWGIPSYSVLGWQRPCYLLSDGYAATYQELLETTDWEGYGRGRNEKCAQCMAHCGYEPTAIVATSASLRESLRATREVVRGQFMRPKTPVA
jgi:hopanoid biosynthesis associated radical SAM protein HpnH